MHLVYFVEYKTSLHKGALEMLAYGTAVKFK